MTFQLDRDREKERIKERDRERKIAEGKREGKRREGKGCGGLFEDLDECTECQCVPTWFGVGGGGGCRGGEEKDLSGDI